MRPGVAQPWSGCRARTPFGDGHDAEMSFYTAPSGAKVFAGAFSLACSIWQPPVRTMVANLLARLAPAARPGL
jgi:hypothetical protein